MSASVEPSPVLKPGSGSTRKTTTTSSLDIALAFPQPGLFAEDLIHRADKALYMAKREGRNRLVFAPDL